MLKHQPWHDIARRMKDEGSSLSMIAKACGVSPQMVSIVLDPEKQARRRSYVRIWNQRRRHPPRRDLSFYGLLAEFDRANAEEWLEEWEDAQIMGDVWDILDDYNLMEELR